MANFVIFICSGLLLSLHAYLKFKKITTFQYYEYEVKKEKKKSKVIVKKDDSKKNRVDIRSSIKYQDQNESANIPIKEETRSETITND